MDLPAGTELVNLGHREVFVGRPSTRKVIMLLHAGASVMLDGTLLSLDRDVEVAGVMNHIDPNDPYNTGRKR